MLAFRPIYLFLLNTMLRRPMSWPTKVLHLRGYSLFGKSDATRFFGREEAVQSLLELVKHERLILIAGPSEVENRLSSWRVCYRG